MISDSDSSTRNASRSVGRDTPNCSISTASDGSASPSASSPRTILRRSSAATSSAVSGDGGGIYNEGEAVVSFGSVVSNNVAFGGGGGIYNAGGLTVTGSSLGGNLAIGGNDLDASVMLALRVGPLGALLREQPQLAPRVEADVRAALASHLEQGVVRMGGAVWIVRATAP